jgi:hypothetical protein
MTRKLGLMLGILASLMGSGAPATAAEQGFEHFVRREGDLLKDGDRAFRFISVNIPNLHYVEDDLRFDQSMPFRFLSDDEIDDALETVAQLGGQVVRMYALSVRKADGPWSIVAAGVSDAQVRYRALKDDTQISRVEVEHGDINP